MSEKKKLSAKQYLEQLQIIDEIIRQDLEQLDTLRRDAGSAEGIDYGRDKVQTSVHGNRLSDDVIRIISLNEAINAEIDRFADIRQQIIGEIRELRVKNQVSILYKVYVQFKSIRTAAEEMKISYGYAREVHKHALSAFSDMHRNLHYLH